MDVTLASSRRPTQKQPKHAALMLTTKDSRRKIRPPMVSYAFVNINRAQ